MYKIIHATEAYALVCCNFQKYIVVDLQNGAAAFPASAAQVEEHFGVSGRRLQMNNAWPASVQYPDFSFDDMAAEYFPAAPEEDAAEAAQEESRPMNNIIRKVKLTQNITIGTRTMAEGKELRPVEVDVINDIIICAEETQATGWGFYSKCYGMGKGLQEVRLSFSQVEWVEYAATPEGEARHAKALHWWKGEQQARKLMASKKTHKAA